MLQASLNIFISIFDKTPMRLHLFICEDLNEDVLISADHLEVLGLIPELWPHCLDPKYKKHYSSNCMFKSAAMEKEMEEDSGIDSETESEGEVKNEEPPVNILRTRVNL